MRLLAAVLLILVLIAAMIYGTRPVDASHGDDWTWATLNDPFTLTVVDATDWDLGALSLWEASGVVRFNVVDGSGVDRQACPFGAPGQVVVCSADYGPTAWLGATSRQASTFNGETHMKYARVRLNDFYGGPAPEPTPRPSATPRPDPTPKTCKGKGNPHCLKSDGSVQGLVCHEIGHALGLNHQNDNTSCMQSPGGGNRPNAHDLDTLRLIYAGLDTEWCATVPAWTQIPCLP